MEDNLDKIYFSSDSDSFNSFLEKFGSEKNEKLIFDILEEDVNNSLNFTEENANNNAIKENSQSPHNTGFLN